MLAPGGMTSRSLSFGWSWWTPWMMKCIRRPKALSGSQWKNLRCSQYSESVQIANPARISRMISTAPWPSLAPSQTSAAITGM